MNLSTRMLLFRQLIMHFLRLLCMLSLTSKISLNSTRFSYYFYFILSQTNSKLIRSSCYEIYNQYEAFNFDVITRTDICSASNCETSQIANSSLIGKYFWPKISRNIVTYAFLPNAFRRNANNLNCMYCDLVFTIWDNHKSNFSTNLW